MFALLLPHRISGDEARKSLHDILPVAAVPFSPLRENPVHSIAGNLVTPLNIRVSCRNTWRVMRHAVLGESKRNDRDVDLFR
jgi:hypothetical protein